MTKFHSFIHSFIHSLEKINIFRMGYMKLNMKIIAMMLCVVSAVFFTACFDDDEDPAKTYAIGDTGPSGVGIVFYVTDGGLHGLEVAPVDQGAGTQWKTSTTSTTGTSTGIGTGSANTAAMAGVSHPAAELCRAYTGGGKTDWFLPSKDELDAIWDNLVNNGSGGNNGVGGFDTSYYWSSSEIDAATASSQSFNNGNPGNSNKTTATPRVRAIRAF